MWVYDSIVMKRNMIHRYLYSDNLMFGEYDLPRTGHGYYGQHGPLYTSSDHFASPVQLTFLLDASFYPVEVSMERDTLGRAALSERSSHSNNSFYTADSLVVSMKLASDAHYRYRASVQANYGGGQSYVPEVSIYDDGTGDVDDYIGDISEIFNELGNQEGYQVYSNVEGGYGHLSLLNGSAQTLYPDQLP